MGKFKSKGIVTKFEHLANACLRASSRLFFSHTVDSPADGGDWCPKTGSFKPIRVFCYRGDATNQEAIQKSKVHLSDVASCIVDHDVLEGCRNSDNEFQLESFVAPYMRCVCGIQRVVTSTSSELYNMMLRELQSVGCPHWLSAEHDASRTVVYAFVMDQGPDNQGATRFIKQLLVDKPSTMMLTVWCFMHQYHLIVKNLLVMLDKHRWSGSPINTEYFSLLSAVSNCWRSPGNPTKIYNKTCEKFGDLAGKLYAKTVPGKAVRGRWGSIDNLEALLDRGSHILAAVFSDLFGSSMVVAKSKSKLPGAAEDEERREHRRKWTTMSGAAMSSSLHRALIRFSLKVKEPIFKFFCWAEKMRSKHISERKKADQTNVAPLQQSFVHALVSHRAATAMSEISALLDPLSADVNWGPVWQLIDNNINTQESKVLIIG